MANEAAPLLVKASEAARMLSISERTLARLTAAGELRIVGLGEPQHRKFGNKTVQRFPATRYDVRDLVAYIDRIKSKQVNSN